MDRSGEEARKRWGGIGQSEWQHSMIHVLATGHRLFQKHTSVITAESLL